VEPWTASPWVLFLSVSMGIGAWLAARTIEAWWRGTQIPKEMSRWVTELDAALRDLQATEIGRAICYRRVADLIGQIPADFDAVALRGLQMSDDIGRAILAKAEAMGLYPPGTFQKLGVPPFRGLGPSAASPSSQAEADEDAPPVTIAAQAPLPGNGGGEVVTPWQGTWVEGRLVPVTHRPPPPEN
jgi:hypothetical protein